MSVNAAYNELRKEFEKIKEKYSDEEKKGRSFTCKYKGFTIKVEHGFGATLGKHSEFPKGKERKKIEFTNSLYTVKNAEEFDLLVDGMSRYPDARITLLMNEEETLDFRRRSLRAEIEAVENKLKSLEPKSQAEEIKIKKLKTK